MILLDYIKKENLTFKSFARKIGKRIHPQSIHKYAHFDNYPKPDMAKKIVSVTNNEVTWADIYKPKK